MNRLIRSILLVLLSIATWGAAAAQSDLAPLKVTTNEGAEPGFLYLAPNCRVSPRPYGSYLGVYNANGGVLRTGRTTNYPFEYKVFPDGRLGYSELVVFSGASVPAGVFIVDTFLREVDTLRQARGYLTTQHDMHILPNGHRLLLGAEDVTVDMSTVIEGGHPAANVVQAVIQEIDVQGNVVVQWKALDHLPITDSYEDLTAATIRYCHNNSLWIDDDGNWLLSMRHMSQVVKIDRQTGTVLWILGGKRNQFTFVNEHEENAPTYFSYQHDVRRIANGNITLFDNGTQHRPQYSRGAEYALDEVNRTCRLVWEYRHVPDIYVSIQGGMQTLENGHRLLGWGSAANDGAPGVTEVDSTGTVVFEAAYPKQMYVYRATKLPMWPPGRSAASMTIRDVVPSEEYRYRNDRQDVGLRVVFTELSSFFYNSTTARRYAWSPVNPRWAEEAPNLHHGRVTLAVEGIRSHTLTARFQVDTLGIRMDPSRVTVFHRPMIDSGTFTALSTTYDAATRELVVTGATSGEFAFGSRAPSLQAPPVPTLLWPVGGERVLERASHDLRVTPNGRVDSIRIQVASDPQFSMIAFDGTTSSDRTAFLTGPATALWYWRAQAIVGAERSGWTSVDSFRVWVPYIEVTRPSTDVVWMHDARYPISWMTDIAGSVRIELTKNDQVVSVVADSVPARAQGYLWLVPVSVPVGTDYRVRIVARDAPFATIAATGEASVTITDIVSVRDDAPRTKSPLSVWPAPARDVVTIENIISGCAHAELYAVSGERVGGAHGVETRLRLDVRDLPNGVYLARVTDHRGAMYTTTVHVAR